MYRKVLFWNVDTQVDFMEPDGKLYVPGAEEIRSTLAWLTQFAKSQNIRVINTADFHQINSEELSDHPNYANSFPQHCMAGTPGADYIPETAPETPGIIDWDKEVAIFPELDDSKKFRNLIIRKDAFDVFSGNQNTDNVLKLLAPEKVFVYGVTTNVCVDYAVVGLAERGIDVFVVEDAIKELPNLDLPFDKWSALNVKIILSKNIPTYL